ncbi:hypothetical protein Celaphus_00002628, partial [Cervus elaphus hippelaphus]
SSEKEGWWKRFSASGGSSTRPGSSHSRSPSTSRRSRGSSGSPSPSQGRQDNRWHSCSKSKPPKRDGKGRKRQSPSPKSTEVHSRRLTRNVTKGHISENPDEAGKVLKAHGQRKNRWPEDHCYCCAGPLASAIPQATESSQENAPTTSHGAQAIHHRLG